MMTIRWKTAARRLGRIFHSGASLSPAGLLALALTLAVAQNAHATVLNWSFATQAVSDNFNPKLPETITASGTITISANPVISNYDDGFGNLYAAQTYTVTGITGTIIGSGLSASITGMFSYGVSWNGFTTDNQLQILSGGNGFALAPTGVLVIQLNSSVDGDTALGLSADPFFGGFIDTANGSEWQGGLTLTPQPQTQAAPEPAAFSVMGIGLLGVAYSRRRAFRAAANRR